MEVRDTPVWLSFNGGEPKKARRGDTLLRALQAAGVAIPTLCGGRAKCGKCIVTVTSGGGQLTGPERRFITPGLEAQGMRLSCQVVLEGDISVVVPQEYIKAKTCHCRVASVNWLNHDTVRLGVTLEDGGTLDFKPGQFVELDIPVEGMENLKRSYSLSSHPTQSTLSFIIRNVPFGRATRRLQHQTKPGDRLKLSGPFGDFYLRNTPKPALFIAGGSGVSPFYSIIEDMGLRGIKKKVSFYLGQSKPEDFYELDQLKALCGKTGCVEFFPVCCMVGEGQDWPYARGLVTDAIKQRHDDLAGYEGYLCGGPGMIEACVSLLKSKGMEEAAIFYDNFA